MLIVLFGAVFVCLRRYDSNLDVQLGPQLRAQVDVAKLQDLQNKERTANTLFDYTEQVSGAVVSWTPYLRWVEAIRPAGITLSQASLDLKGSGLVVGTAPSREGLLAYRDFLMKQKQITDVNLPFQYVLGATVSVPFVISFKVPDIHAFDGF